MKSDRDGSARTEGSHPDRARWIDFVEGAVKKPERPALERHLADCDACRGTEAQVRRLLDTLARGEPEAPSESAMNAVLGAFGGSEAAAVGPRPAGLPKSTRDLVDRVVGMVFDSFAQPDVAFAGTRSSALARRVRFEGRDLELDALVESRGDQRRLTVQLLALGLEARPISHADVWIAVGGRLEASGRTDTHGQRVEEVTGPGEIEIFVSSGRHLNRFVIPDKATGREDGATTDRSR